MTDTKVSETVAMSSVPPHVAVGALAGHVHTGVGRTPAGAPGLPAVGASLRAEDSKQEPESLTAWLARAGLAVGFSATIAEKLLAVLTEQEWDDASDITRVSDSGFAAWLAKIPVGKQPKFIDWFAAGTLSAPSPVPVAHPPASCVVLAEKRAHEQKQTELEEKRKGASVPGPFIPGDSLLLTRPRRVRFRFQAWRQWRQWRQQ